jgi:hypothetical protein
MEKTISDIFSLDKPFFLLKKTKLPLKALLEIGVIGGVVGFITLLHYQTASDAGIRHVIFRELYFLPIILGGFWFGLRGGLLTALAISLLYGPLILSLWSTDFVRSRQIFHTQFWEYHGNSAFLSYWRNFRLA